MQRRHWIVGASVTAVALVVLVAGTVLAFNPQPDPPAFGIVSINPDQTIRLNVFCWAHVVGDVPPGPCRGQLMFHDMAGNVVASSRYRLTPGQATFLDFTPSPRGVGPGDGIRSVGGFQPCILPNPDSGRALPTVDVFDTLSGRITLHVNPLTPRISMIKVDAGVEDPNIRPSR